MADDLYGDLDDADVKLAAPSKKKNNAGGDLNGQNTTNLSTMSTPADDALKVQELDRLRTENEVLQKNMGTLYRTAKAELARKDAIIDRLQNELDSVAR